HYRSEERQQVVTADAPDRGPEKARIFANTCRRGSWLAAWLNIGNGRRAPPYNKRQLDAAVTIAPEWRAAPVATKKYLRRI
ncbi:MAG: hypothetical protein VB875_11865, partial [Pirellulales bacterium]